MKRGLKRRLCHIDGLMPDNLFFWIAYGLIVGHGTQNYPAGLALGLAFGAARNRRRPQVNSSNITRDPVIDTDNASVKCLQLYHFTQCPYCIKVRLALWWMKLDIPLKNIHKRPDYKEELVAGGGKKQVPCLRIETAGNTVRWLYESDDIIRFLKQTA